MKFIALTLLLAICCSAQGSAARPVMIGINVELDACPSLSQVGGAKSGLISVRAGPGSNYREIDRLPVGQLVSSCDEAQEWTGIVYMPGDADADCSVSSHIPKAVPYEGKCRSGWVRSKWLTVIAG